MAGPTPEEWDRRHAQEQEHFANLRQEHDSLPEFISGRLQAVGWSEEEADRAGRELVSKYSTQTPTLASIIKLQVDLIELFRRESS